MEIAAFQPKVVASWTLPLEEVRVLPIGDIQYGAQGCDIERLKRHLEWGMKNDCYFLGMGDYLDVASPSNRRMLQEVTLYDSVREMMDNKMEDELKALLHILAPTRGRWLGLVSGHHLWPFQDGTTTDTRLALALDTKYMGDGAAMSVLQFKHQSGKKSFQYGSAKIWYHHGVGTAQTPGGKLNRLTRIAQTFFAHVYLMGHVHAKVHTKEPWIDVEVTSTGKLRWRSTNRILATTGGFLKGYEMGTKNPMGHPAGSYVEKAMLAPTALGGVLLMFRPKLVEGRVEIDLGYQDG